MRIFSNPSLLDTLGMWTSSLCAIHCLLLPFFLSVSAFGGLVFLHDPVMENTVLSVCAVLGVASLFPSYFRQHRKFAAIIILLFGFLLIGLSRFMVNVNESIFTSSGAAAVASAHFINFRLCRKSHKSF